MARFVALERQFRNRAEQAAAVAFLFLALLLPSVAKPYVDTFAIGLSYAKVYALAAYALLLAFSPVLSGLAGRLQQRFGQVRALSWPADLLGKKWAVLVVILCVYAYGLAGHYYFVSQVNGEPGTAYRVFGPEGYTLEYVSHVHASKTAFCALAPSAESFDCASPMLPYLPSGYPLLGLALLMLATLSCVLQYGKLGSGWEKFAFAVLSFGALKNSLDGGLFDYEVFSLFMLAGFLLAKRNRLAGTAAGAVAWSVFVMASPYDSFMISGKGALDYFLPFGLLFYCVCLALMKPRLFFLLAMPALAAPLALPIQQPLIDHRWAGEACSHSEVQPNTEQVIWTHLYTPCIGELKLLCGNLSANGSGAVYRGLSPVNHQLLMARGLFELCGRGVYDNERMRYPPQVKR
jgi:hypothetical protein